MKYEPMVWYGWNGGECPVHPETIVDVIFRDGSGADELPRRAGKWVWYSDTHPVVFRVVREYKEPREFWIELNKDKSFCAFHKEYDKYYDGTELVHVREVLD